MRDDLGWAGHGDFLGAAYSYKIDNTQCPINGSSELVLEGFPAGARVAKAHIIWAWSNLLPLDDPENQASFNVTLNGTSISAPTDRQYEFTFDNGGQLNRFYSAGAEVTSIVDSVIRSGQNRFKFDGITDTNLGEQCAQLAIKGWNLIVYYEVSEADKATELFRTINLFEGFDSFRYESLTLIPKNFRIPVSEDGDLIIPDGVHVGKHAHITWEGDADISDAQENLEFGGQPLTNTYNLINEQYNSTFSDDVVGVSQTGLYGLDFDIYDITKTVKDSHDPMFAIPDIETEVTTLYSAGQDLVILSAEVLSIMNVDVTDLEVNQGNYLSEQLIRGNTANLRILVDNHGPFATSGSLTTTVTLPADLSLFGATSFNSNGWSCVSVSASNDVLDCTKNVSLLDGQQDYFDIAVSVSLSANPTFTVQVSIPGVVDNPYPIADGNFDNVTSNNSKEFTYSVFISGADLTTSTKTVNDLNKGGVEAGDLLEYTVTITESANDAIYNVSVSDVLPSNLEQLTIIELPAGAIDNSTSTQVNVSNIDIAASGQALIRYTARVSSSVQPAENITNIATITNLDLADVIVSSSVSVYNSTPASGVKQLYLRHPSDAPASALLPGAIGRLSREATTTDAGTLFIDKNDGGAKCLDGDLSQVYCLVFTLDPLLVSDLQIDEVDLDVVITGAGKGDNYGFALINNNNDIIAQYNLDATEADVKLNGTAIVRSYTLQVNSANALVQAGDTLRLVIQNNGNNKKGINIIPFSNSAPGVFSQLRINTSTVINVDNIDTLDSSTVLTSNNFERGSQMLSRVIVSDPFGTFDIENVSIVMTDANDNEVLNIASASALTEIPDDVVLTSAQQLYEFTYDIPADAALGVWQIFVQADEGKEGVILDNDVYAFSVYVPPVLDVSKSVALASAPTTPISNAKLGDVLQYTILIANNSLGDAVNIMLNENISPYSALKFTSTNPVDDSFNCLDCVEAGISYSEPVYSNSHDNNFTYTPVIVDNGAGEPIDPNVTNIKIDLTGTLKPDKSITFTYQVVVN
ncbi:hypothetical protein [Thalassotalea aquiviva]|uniref:hypothetical protein n=1 Tax=Thalassotalea aquiviva TaxID=3242415 RepID=UPI00352AA252